MPTCPGCRRHVAHDDLPVHQRYCRWLWETEPVARRAWDDHLADELRGLDHRAVVSTVTRLERRVRRLESDVADDGA